MRRGAGMPSVFYDGHGGLAEPAVSSAWREAQVQILLGNANTRLPGFASQQIPETGAALPGASDEGDPMGMRLAFFTAGILLVWLVMFTGGRI